MPVVASFVCSQGDPMSKPAVTLPKAFAVACAIAVVLLAPAAKSQTTPVAKMLSHASHTPEEEGRLGDAYLNGDGVPADPNEASRWYLAAANAGDPRSQTALAMLYLSRRIHGAEKDAIPWLRRASSQQYAPATYYLGHAYYFGKGVASDVDEAARLIQRAAEKEYAPAEADLGALYVLGHGVERDLRRALHWLQKAAKQKDASAEFTLGMLYANGEGVGQDQSRAVKWLRLAAEHGDARAQNNLGTACELGIGLTQDIDAAVRWYRAAADNGSPASFRNLGRLYYFGQGVAPDRKQALVWLRAAQLAGGLADGAQELGEELASLSAAERQNVEELAKGIAARHDAIGDSIGQGDAALRLAGLKVQP